MMYKPSQKQSYKLVKKKCFHELNNALKKTIDKYKGLAVPNFNLTDSGCIKYTKYLKKILSQCLNAIVGTLII